MKIKIAHKILNVLLISVLFFASNKLVLIDSKMTKLEYLRDINGEEILNNIDELLAHTEDALKNDFSNDYSMLEGSSANNITLQLKKADFLNKLKRDKSVTNGFFAEDTLPSSLSQVWNNTVMMFGANADGIGIGTGFAVKKNMGENVAVFVTAYHVVENFCDFPADYDNMDFSAEKTIGKNISCKGLYVLNDLAINTENNKVQVDGKLPWKAVVKEVLYFDKVNDVAIFKIAVPGWSKITEIQVAVDYDVKSPMLVKNSKDKEAKPVSLKEFDIFAIGYPSLYKTVDNVQVHDKGLISKRWSTGRYLRTKTFEGPEELGLIKAFKHTLYSLPGSSGGPLTLDDGRIIGVNFSKILNTYYERVAGCSQAKRLVKEDEYYAIPSINLKSALESK